VFGFLLKRIALGVVALWAGSFLSFCFFASVFLPLRGRPLLPAYWHWLSGMPDGRSFSQGLVLGRLWPIVLPALAHTAVLLAYVLVLVAVFAIAVGCFGALRRGSPVDALLRSITYGAWAVPPFIVGLVLQLVFAGELGGRSGLGWFPAAGWAGQCPGGIGIDLHTFRCPSAGSGVVYVGHVLWFLTLPAVALAAGFVGLHARYLRAALVAQLDAPYIATARAKGLSERRVVLRHALRNSLAVVVPVVLGDFGAIFGASLAVDFLFGLNGIGSVFVRVLNWNSNVPVVDTYAAQLLLLIGGALVIAVSVLGELAVGLIDPRVGFER